MVACSPLSGQLPPGIDEDEDEEEEEDSELYDEQELAAMDAHGGRQTELLLELDDWVKFRVRAYCTIRSEI